MLAMFGHSFWSFYLRINALQFVAALLYAAYRTVQFWQHGPRPMPPTPRPTKRAHPLWNRTSLRKPVDIAHSVLVSLLFAPMRIAAALFCITLCRVMVALAVVGLSHEDLRAKPLTGIRRFIISTAFTSCSRGLLFSFGFWYIETHGKRMPPSVAPVLVSNHITLVEGIALTTAELCATCVTRNQNMDIPLIGGIIEALQPIVVDRNSRDSRRESMRAITERSRQSVDPDQASWPQLVIFPEGSTGNGSEIMRFRLGAFTPGVAIQPAVVSYDCGPLDPCLANGGPDVVLTAGLLCTRVCHELHLRYLDVRQPTKAEVKDPALFAENTRRVMAKALGCPMSEYSIKDMTLQQEANRHGLPWETGVARIEALEGRGLTLDGAKRRLARFAAVSKSRGNALDSDKLAAALSVAADSPLLARVLRALGHDSRREPATFQRVLERTLPRHSKNVAPGIRGVFDAVAGRGADSVSVDAFVKAVSAAVPGAKDEDTRALFAHLDTEEAGRVSFDNWARLAREVPEALAVAAAVLGTKL